MAIAKSAGWWWPFTDAVILTERPELIERDMQGRLHAERGPAIRYRDGWSIYVWHGVRVPASIIEHPETITAKAITAESNAEIRRVMVTRMGAERYVAELGVRRTQADDYGELYRVSRPDDSDLVLVKVQNSTPEPDGHFKDYFLRVHPDCQSAREGIAWSFAKDTASAYEPAVET
jgi:hypothetical protein